MVEHVECNISDDDKRGITAFIHPLQKQYGLTLNDERHIIVYHDKDVNNKYRYLYLTYRSYIMVLKCLIIAEENPKPVGHFRTYLRVKFSCNFYIISDTQICPSTIEDTYAESVCMALYYTDILRKFGICIFKC